MLNEEILEFQGPDKLTRRGIISLPNDLKTTKTAVIFLIAGLKYRTGPHRWYVRFARKLSSLGYLALRFDPLGVGESDGLIETNPTHTVWNTVDNGRFVSDTILAVETIKSRYKIDNVILIGICGGAITAQFSAAERPDLISGIVSINTALTLSVDKKTTITTHKEAKHTLSMYVSKLFSFKAWVRFFSGISEFRAIFSSFISLFIKEKKSIEGQNPKFLKSFLKLIQSNQKHLLIFSEHDTRWFDFSSSFLINILNNKMSGKGYKIILIPKANHLIYLENWKTQVETEIIQWLKEFN